MSAVESLLFSMKNTPRMTSSATRPPTTEPMMICFFLRALAASARCSARVFCGYAVLWVRYGLELARNGIERLRRGGFTGRSHGHGVRVHFGLLACLHIGSDRSTD